VGDERCEAGGCNAESNDGEHKPECAIGPEEEERSGGRSNCRDSEHREEEEVVAETIHRAVSLPVGTTRRGHVNGDDRKGHQEGDDVSGDDQADLDDGSHDGRVESRA